MRFTHQILQLKAKIYYCFSWVF